MQKPLVVVVAGPTASGKTSLAVKLAKKFDGEVVSADSMQVYKNMDIATAKPSKEEMEGVPHHLIGVIDEGSDFSVALYKEMALSAISDIISRGKLPIVAGGTGLYIDTLVNNTEFLDFEKSDIRETLEERAKNEGIEKLYDELLEVDEEAAKKLHINDEKRIIRALEVYLSTGKTISQQCELSHLKGSDYRFCLIALGAENRDYLYERINRRVDVMLDMGLIEEAKKFFCSDISKTAKQAIGYKELKPYLDGYCTLEQAVENLKMQTRRYAKRQLTWFRRNEAISWLYIDTLTGDELLEKASDIIDMNR